MLKSLSIKNVGPAPELTLEFGKRLNLLTGDNGLGKSFLLDIAWWSLTRRWPAELNASLASGYMARPKPGASASINFSFTTKSRKIERYESKFNRAKQAWMGRQGRPSNPGLVLYAQVDGSFAVWDPARNYWKKEGNIDVKERQPAYVFSPKDVWEGLQGEKGEWLCNGLIRDWASWQREGKNAFKLLEGIVRLLSPSEGEQIAIGELTRIGIEDARDIPTLKMPNGEETPVLYASAGVRRIIALAYLLVWTWKEHLAACKLLGEEPASQVVFLVDEIEAHLHPRWQRSVVRSLLSVVTKLARNKKQPMAQVQLIAATHSPLVMASVEPIFDAKQDAWFDFDLVQKQGGSSHVQLTARHFTRQGDVSRWLMSEAFDLTAPRSLEAEKALASAIAIIEQLDAGKEVSDERIADTESALQGALSDTDIFWSRWHYALTRHEREQ